MKTECYSYQKGSIICQPYYPIEKGEYIIKLINNGYFDNGMMVLPFDLSNDMYPEENNEEEDRRVKLYKTLNQLPIFKSYSTMNGLYGNFYFYNNIISLYNKTEIIKDKYPIDVELVFCYLDNGCSIDNKYQIECNITKMSEDLYEIKNYDKGEYLLKCKGIINTNVYNIENFGNHIEIRYKIGESSIQDIEIGLLFYSDFRKQSPRDILEITSFNYEYNPIEVIFFILLEILYIIKKLGILVQV